MDPCLLGEPDEFGGGMHAELHEGVRAVHLDGAQFKVERSGDLLVGLAAVALEDFTDDLAFAGGERLEARAKAVAVHRLDGLGDASCNGGVDLRDEFGGLDRLFKKVDGALLHRGHGGGNAAVGRKEDDRQPASHFDELVLDFRTREAGHAHVKHDAAGTRQVVVVEEPPAARIRGGVPAHGFEQKSEGSGKCLVVVNDADQRSLQSCSPFVFCLFPAACFRDCAAFRFPPRPADSPFHGRAGLSWIVSERPKAHPEEAFV